MRIKVTGRSPQAPATRPSVTAPRRDRRFATLIAWLVGFQVIYMVLNLHLGAGGAGGAANPMGASVIGRSVKLTLLGLGALVVFSRMSVARGVIKHTNRFFLAFLALAVASVIWSIDSSATINRLVTLATAVMVCFAFGSGAWNPRRMQEVLRTPLTLILVASLIVGIINPALVKEVGTDISLKNSWMGLTSQKNEFGEVSTFALILWLHAWLSRDVPVWKSAAGLGVSLVCLVLSRSSTSLFCSVFATMLMLILLRSGAVARRYLPYIVGAFATICTLYGLAVMNIVPGIERILLDPVTMFTGKNLTFSNRTEIWGIVEENIARHPWLGSGYGAYWGAGPVITSPSYEFVLRMGGFWPTESHNGYYEIRNDLGLVGLICLFGYLYAYVRQCLALFRTDRAQATLFLALLFDQMFLNLSESTWLDQYNFCFSVMTVATMAIARGLLEKQRGNYGSPQQR
jgi:exopolysaccharide production protein ExoQ